MVATLPPVVSKPTSCVRQRNPTEAGSAMLRCKDKRNRFSTLEKNSIEKLANWFDRAPI
jgi:hypothetical protein